MIDSLVRNFSTSAARAAPYEKGTETVARPPASCRRPGAARAAPYEKGTETMTDPLVRCSPRTAARAAPYEKGTETSDRSEEHTSELQSLRHLVCRLLL